MATVGHACNLCGDFSEYFSSSGTVSIQSGTTRVSEAYALEVNPTTTGTGFVVIGATAATGLLTSANAVTSFIRFYFLYNTKPASNDEPIFSVVTLATGGSVKLEIRLKSSGILTAYDAALSLLATGTTVLSSGTWYGIQVECGTSATVGVYEVRISQSGGAFVSEFSGMGNLRATNAGGIRLGKPINRNSNTVDFFYSDVLWSDSAYPGHGQSVLMNTASNGSNTSGTAHGAATLWQCLNQVPPDGDTTYVDLLLAGQSYTANMTASGVIGTINTVKAFTVVRDITTLTGSPSQTIVSGATTQSTTSVSLSGTAYQFQGQILDTDPNTSSTWTTSNLDALQCGFTESVAGSRWTAAFVAVDYLPSTVVPYPQSSQRFDPQPVLDTWWEQFRQQPQPQTFLPLPPTLQQDSQRWDAQPVLDTWWEQFRLQPVLSTFLPLPSTLQQNSQRWDALPDYNWSWEQLRLQPVVTTFLPTPFPVQQSQRIESLPVFDTWWEQFRLQPIATTSLPPLPTLQQDSQRWDSLPDFSSWWEQYRQQPIPLTFLLTFPPAQDSQRIESLTVLDTWWEQFRQQPQPQTFLPLPPTMQQDSQRWDALLDNTWSWQHVYQSVLFPIILPPTKQPSQRWDDLPRFDSYWWEQAVPMQGRTVLPSSDIEFIQVNSTHLTSTSSGTVIFNNNLTAGNAIIAIAQGNSSGGVSPLRVTDSQLNSYQFVSSVFNPTSGLFASIFIAYGVSAGANTLTFNVGPSMPTQMDVYAYEYSGVNSVDSSVTNTGTSSTMTTGSFPVNFGGETAFAVFTTGTSTIYNPSVLGLNIRATNVNSVCSTTGGDTHNVPIGTIAPSISISSSLAYVAVGVLLSTQLRVFPPTFQPSQRWDAQPVLDTWWEQFRLQPMPLTFLPTPFPPQASQRIESLPDHNSLWWQHTYVQIVSFFPPPPTHQPSQRFDPLPDLNSLWWQHTYVQTVSYVPTPPPTHQPSQRWDDVPHYDTWWEQFRRWPIVAQFIPPPPPTKQLSQRFDPLPDLNEQWWGQYPYVNARIPLPSWIYVSQEGVYDILNTMEGAGQVGGYRTQNAILGYNVYVGVNGLPDLTQPPTTWSATLPVSVPITPPVSGTETLYVLVQTQDNYGLVSANQYYTIFIIDSTGGFVLSIIAPPQTLQLFQQEGQMIRLLAEYPTANLDTAPATSWKIWAALTLPNPMVDIPVSVVAVSGVNLITAIGPFSPGTYYVMVGLYRIADNSLSTTIYSTVVVSGLPSEVIPVPSGFQE